MKSVSIIIWTIVVGLTPLAAQTIYVPGGIVGTSANGNIGIGTSNPNEPLTITKDGIDELGSSPRTIANFRNGNGGKGLYIGYDNNEQLATVFPQGSSSGITFWSHNGSSWGERLRIHTNGNIGIGTTSPQAKFVVEGAGAIKQYISNTLSSGYSSLSLLNNTGSGLRTLDLNYSGSAYSGSLVTNGSTGEAGTIGTTGNFPLDIATNNTARITITGAGNVGIGTISPEVGTHLFQKASGWAATSGATQAYGIFRLEPADSNGVLDFGMNAGSGAWLQATHRTDLSQTYPLLFNPNGGNVGIGTTSPGSYKLAVNGTIHAKEVVVDNIGWPDFVFADDYRLAPLSEVESHIRDKKHLPGIPSAAEVAERGISLGDMQARLLAKVEELTLHAIAQEKRNNSQQAEIAALRAELASLSHPR